MAWHLKSYVAILRHFVERLVFRAYVKRQREPLATRKLRGDMMSFRKLDELVVLLSFFVFCFISSVVFVVFGSSCRVGTAFLRRQMRIFPQVPFSITVGGFFFAGLSEVFLCRCWMVGLEFWITLNIVKLNQFVIKYLFDWSEG